MSPWSRVTTGTYPSCSRALESSIVASSALAQTREARDGRLARAAAGTARRVSDTARDGAPGPQRQLALGRLDALGGQQRADELAEHDR